MKKSFLVGILVMLCFIATGCGNKAETKTCTRTVEGSYDETFVMSATNNTIDKIDVTYVYYNELFGVETLSNLTDEQKTQIKNEMLKNLSLEKYEYDGLKISIDIADRMTVNIKAELNVADVDVMKKIGLDFTNTNKNFDDGVKSMTDASYTCK